MTARIELDEGSAELITEEHRFACQQIDATTKGVPAAFDGGIADGHVVQILEEVVRTAGEIAGINLGISMLVTEAARQLKLTDEQVSDTFDAARQELE